MSYSAKIENTLKYSGVIEVADAADLNFNLCDHLGNTITDQRNSMILGLTEKLKRLYSAIIEILKK